MKAFIYLVIIVVSAGLCIKLPELMLNPGPLSQGHQKINEQCSSCHQLFWGLPDTKCMACHKFSDSLSDSSINKRSLQFHNGLKMQSCTSCHTDHKGTDPQLATMRFDHRLLSAIVLSNCTTCHVTPTDSLHIHLSVSCGNCHNTRQWKFSGSFDHSLIKEISQTNCISCHPKPDDALHLSLQNNCIDCHSTQQWSPASFDHSSYFILDRHHNVKCITCHANNNFQSYTCYGCHEHSQNKIMDEHRKEGIVEFSDCASCHKSGNKHDIRFKEGEGNKTTDGVKKYMERERKREGRKRGKDDDD